MSTVQGVSQTSAASSTTGSAGQAQDAASSQDRFLKLLVAQLQNQDPLNPMDNAAITSQMAQISTVSGIEQLNTTLQSLATKDQAGQQIQSAALVGHQILMNGSTLQLGQDGAVGGFSLDQAVDQLTVTVSDASGAVLHTATLGAQEAGMHTFQWDGVTDSGQQAAAGSYTFKVTGLAAGKSVAPQTLQLGSVMGVRMGDSGPTLDLGSQGTAAMSDVKQIF